MLCGFNLIVIWQLNHGYGLICVSCTFDDELLQCTTSVLADISSSVIDTECNEVVNDRCSFCWNSLLVDADDEVLSVGDVIVDDSLEGAPSIVSLDEGYDVGTVVVVCNDDSAL